MKYLMVLLMLVSGESIMAQDVADSVYEQMGLAHLMRLINLKPSDLTFREDYTEIDSLRLASISGLMHRPYGMIEFTERLADACRGDSPEAIMSFAFDNLGRSIQSKRDYAIVSDDKDLPDKYLTYYNSFDFNRLLSFADDYLYYQFPEAMDSSMALLSLDEKKFLIHEFAEIILEDTADEFRSVEAIDSLQKADENTIERFMEFAAKIRKDYYLHTGVAASARLFQEITKIRDNIASGTFVINDILADTIVRPRTTGLAKYLGLNEGWAIGGPGDNNYKGDYYFIIDFGGNDYYELEYDPENPHSTIIIDMSGDDIYHSASDFTIGSGCLSTSLLYDMSGNDIYSGGNFSCGSGYFGFGLVYDGAGHDRYNGDTHTQGAATCGVGMIIDRGGSDIYSAAINAQGYALLEGFGLISDFAGNDNYSLGGKYKALLHYDDHYLSIGQGYGGGLMLFLSGGIGGIVDMDGNDNYISDMVAQGCGWWWGFGFIYDSGGNDQYLSYQYAQGTGVHMGLGLLLDADGKDFYRGKGLMQGVGHDYGCGIILDRNGNDIFQADDLSQGAGSANGFGIMIDSRGDDAYYVIKRTNTQGYGNPRRDFGSIGLFLDLSGKDIYDGNGADSSYWQTDSKWGGGFDWKFIEPVPNESKSDNE